MKLNTMIALAVGTILIMGGCNRIHTVTKDELIKMANPGQATSEANLYYKGSSDKYDYFSIGEGSNQKSYRVSYGNIYLSQRFPLTEDQSKWAKTIVK